MASVWGLVASGPMSIAGQIARRVDGTVRKDKKYGLDDAQVRFLY